MKKFILALVFLIGFNAASKENSKASKVLLIIGDSLTEGYGVNQTEAFPALINKKLIDAKSVWSVKAAGSSGSTSASGLERIKWLTKSKPDLILLLLGSNDGLRGIKTESTEKNLNDTIDWATKNNFKIILGQLKMPPNYGKEYSKSFEKLFVSVAEKNKILLIPFLLDNVAGKSNLNQSDGIHPNKLGHVVVAENIYKSIKKYLK